METKAENWKDHAQKAGSLAVVILGNILYALAVKLFLMPAGLLTGGTTGIGLALNRTFGVPVASFVLIFNVTMLLIGWKVMGRKFALTTVVSTFVYPIALGFFEKLFGDLVLTQDLFLCYCFFRDFGIGGFIRDRDPCRRIYWWYGYSPSGAEPLFQDPGLCFHVCV